MYFKRETNIVDTQNDCYTSKSLSYEQLLKCLSRDDLRIREIELFMLTWKWINNTLLIENFKSSSKSQALATKKINIIRKLMKQIRFALISPSDLVNKVQGVNKLMMKDTFLRHLVMRALNYHVMPVVHSTKSKMKISKKRLSYEFFDMDKSSEDSDDSDESNEVIIYNQLIQFSTTP